MLFDLRARGRRRTVQVLYVFLAILIGGGLVLFGVGGGFGGTGIVSSLTGKEGSGGASFSAEVKKFEALTRQQPSSANAWEKLLTAQLHEAGGEAYTTRTGVTAKGKELFARISSSWERYIALNPPTPSLLLAKEVLRIYGEEGLSQPASAVQVLQIIVAGEPSNASYYTQLAVYAYKAHNTRVGDLASEKAVSLAPAAQRTRLKTELAALKKNPSGLPETATATTNGKAFTVKSSGTGSYTGTVPATTTPPAGSTGKKK
jgi:hypothetical protein